MSDIGYAIRGFRRNFGLSLTAVLTIAIGIGAVASMFTVMRNLLSAPPHVAAPEQVFRLHPAFLSDGTEEQIVAMTSYPFYEFIVGEADSLDSVAAYANTALAAGSGTNARMTRAVLASAGFWRTLRVRPAVGRFIFDAEAHPATGARVVVLGHAFWQGRFGGDVNAVGQTLEIRGQPYEIVGVAPRGFRGVELADVDLWLPLFARGDGTGRPATWHASETSGSLKVIARVSTDYTFEQASSELTSLQRTFLERAYGSTDFSRTLLGPISGGRGDDSRSVPEVRVTAALLGVAVLLVLVACSNVGGLLLLRAMRRRHEIAVRLAMGVSRARLARQLLTESSLLALFGGLAACTAVFWGGAWMQRTILPAMAWEPRAVIDPAVVIVASLATLVAALVAGLAPLGYVKPDLLSAFRGGTAGQSMRRPRMQSGLLLVQGVLSVVLLVGAGLFLESLHNVKKMDIGFDRDALAVQVDFTGTERSDDDVAAFFERALERVSTLPGVMDASLALNVPLRSFRPGSFRLPGEEDLVWSPSGTAPYVNAVTPGFFRTTGMRILAGREFVESDRNGEPVIVVGETMAQLVWRNRSPIGECVYMPQEEVCTTVVGVVADAILFNILEEEPSLYFYTPLARDDSDRRGLLVRTAPGAGRMDGTIRQALQEVDSRLPFIRIETLGDALNPQIRSWHLGASVFTAFGILAMVLTMVGLWSSVSYAVSQRRKEFAIRLAVGADGKSLTRLVLGDGLQVALLAVLAGIAVSASASYFIADLLFDVSPRDPMVLASVAAGFLMVSLLASLPPAVRAWRIHPAEALRAE